MSAPGPRRDDGSLPIALLVTMVATTLGAMVAAVSASGLSIARSDTERPRQLDAAMAGLEVMVGHIRAATDSAGNGILTSLPCGPYSGTVGTGSGAGARETYRVTIQYLDVDAATVIDCKLGSGPVSIPRYAALTSVGTDSLTGATRTLTSRYTIASTNANVAGGRFRASSTVGTVQNPCLDAGSPTPAAGAPVTLTQCVPGSQQQSWAYGNHLQILLVSSVTLAYPQGLCVDGGPVPHGSTAVPLTMQPCLTSDYARQQWNQNDMNDLEGTSDGVHLDGHCLDKQFNTTPTPIVVQPSCVMVFTSDSSVGAGAAGPSTGQLVNYGQFGKCLDVAEYNWQNYRFWLWQCKQAPTAAGVNWNQKWGLPTIVAGPTGTSGYIMNRPPALNGSPACLHSTSSTATTSYVTLVQCPLGPASGSLQWTVYGDTGLYATSFTIVDSAGHCLAPVPASLPNSGAYDNGTPVITQTCDGSTVQKWNANPNKLLPGPLAQFTEK
jgi:Ricin-type beta-trefoil lectin domain